MFNSAILWRVSLKISYATDSFRHNVQAFFKKKKPHSRLSRSRILLIKVVNPATLLTFYPTNTLFVPFLPPRFDGVQHRDSNYLLFFLPGRNCAMHFTGRQMVVVINGLFIRYANALECFLKKTMIRRINARGRAYPR